MVAPPCAGRSSAPARDLRSQQRGRRARTPIMKRRRSSHCMRGNGVSSSRTRRVGTVDRSIRSRRLVDRPNTPAFTRALTACRDLEPSGFTGQQAHLPAAEAALRFAERIREHGVRISGPDPDGPLVDTPRIPVHQYAGGTSVVHAAMQTCAACDSAGGSSGDAGRRARAPAWPAASGRTRDGTETTTTRARSAPPCGRAPFPGMPRGLLATSCGRAPTA